MIVARSDLTQFKSKFVKLRDTGSRRAIGRLNIEAVRLHYEEWFLTKIMTNLFWNS